MVGFEAVGGSSSNPPKGMEQARVSPNPNRSGNGPSSNVTKEAAGKARVSTTSTRSYAEATAGKVNGNKADEGTSSSAEAATSKTVDWSSMAGDLKIPYHAPTIKVGIVLLPKSVYDHASSLWEDSLIGQFVGNSPSYAQIQSTTNLLWGDMAKLM